MHVSLQELNKLPREEVFWSLGDCPVFQACTAMLSNVIAVYDEQTKALRKARTEVVKGSNIKNVPSDPAKHRANVLGTINPGGAEDAPEGLSGTALADWRRARNRTGRVTKKRGQEALRPMWSPVRSAGYINPGSVYLAQGPSWARR